MAQAGAAEVIPDSALTPERLREAAASILSFPARIVEMSAASRSLARPDAAQRIADEVLAAAR
jgi:UDP-N-acetylglucosamine--N-acetylmuramyl-(pentapeptide) pyrophosphoryl-undecaprenol N-acetylglucosamine transferase